MATIMSAIWPATSKQAERSTDPIAERCWTLFDVAAIDDNKEIVTLLNKDLIAHIKTLLSRRGTVPATELKELQLSLCDLGRLSAQWIKRQMPLLDAWLLATINLFDGASTGKSQFYKDNGHPVAAPTSHPSGGRGRGKQAAAKAKTAAKKELEDVPKGPQPFAAAKGVSQYMLDVINAFHAAGGFEHLCRRLEDTTIAGQLTMSNCQHAVTLLHTIRDHITANYGAELIPKFVNSLQKRVYMLFEGKTAPISKPDLDRLLTSLEELHVRHAPTIVAFESSERYRVRLAGMRMIGMREVFDKRVYGINMLNDVVARVENYGKKGKEKESTKWMESKHLASMLNEFKVIDTLICADSHDELVRRSSPLLCFLVGQGSLSPVYLDRLWSSSLSDNSHTAKINSDLLLQLASLLNMANLRHVYHKMEALPLVQYNTDLMTRLSAFCAAALKNQHKRKQDHELDDETSWDWFGLPLFWKASQDDALKSYSGDGEALQEQARKALGDLLKLECCESQREVYIVMCIENIQKDSAAYHSIALLQTILITYPGQQVKHSWNTGGATASSKMKTKLPKIGEYIILLNSRFEFIELLLAELNRFKSRYAPKAATVLETKRPGTSAAAAAVASSSTLFAMNSVAGLPSTYDKQVDTRLKFIEYLLMSSLLLLTAPSLLSIWDVCIENAFSLNERQSALNWIQRLTIVKLNGRDVVGWDRDSCITLFQQRLCRIPPLAHDDNSFRCWQWLFLTVNKHLTAVVATKLESLSKFQLTRFESLDGFETLWSVAMDATKQPVYKAAIALLIRLHSIDRHATPLQKSIKGIRNSFVATCLDYLRGVTPQFGLTTPPAAASPAAAVATTPASPAAAAAAAPSTPSRIPNPNGPASTPPAKASGAAVVAGTPPVVPIIPAARPVTPPSPERISRGILVLRCFVKGEAELEGMGTQVRPLVGTPEQLQLSLQLSPDLRKKSEVSMVSSQTVGELRLYASTAFQHPMEYIQLTRAGGDNKPLLVDAAYLQEIRGNKNAKHIQVYVAKLPLPKDIGTTNENTDTPGGIISSNLTTFRFLYDLMEHPYDYAQEVYELLNLIPVCTPLVAALRQFQLPMDDMLRSQCTLTLLFNLKVVESFLTRKDFESAAISAGRDEWYAAFVKARGLHHVLQVVVRGLPDSNHPTPWLQVMRNRAFGGCLRLLANDLATTMNILDHTPKGRSGMVGRLMGAIRSASSGMSSPAFTQLGAQFVSECSAPTVEVSFKLLAHVITTPIPADAKEDKGSNSKELLLQLAYNFADLPRVIDSVLESPFGGVRAAVCNGIRTFCQDYRTAGGNVTSAGQKAPDAFFSDRLLESLSRIDNDNRNCGDYFKLIQHLFMDAFEHGQSLLAEGRGKLLMVTLTNSITHHPCIEITKHDTDMQLRGLLGLLDVLMQLDPSTKEVAGASLVRELFTNCLFATPTLAQQELDLPLPAKCKHGDTRVAAFQTLNQLVTGCHDNLRELMSLVLMDSIDRPKDCGWGVDPEENTKKHFLGLRNLGATCYMNSLMQQLYMVPGWSQRFLTVRDPDAMQLVRDQEAKAKKPATTTTTSSSSSSSLSSSTTPSLTIGELKTDSIIYHMQKVFQQLETANTQYCDPSPFCLNFRFYGEPINVRQQMDVHEFTNALMNQIHDKLKPSGQEGFLASEFTYTVSEQYTSPLCGHTTSRIATSDMSWMLTLPIQHKRNVKEALQGFIAPETVSKKCSICEEQKGDYSNRDTLKRSLVATLPRTLIIHLSRLTVDWNAGGVARKINDEIKFDHTLDMEPYTIAGQKKAEARASAAARERKEASQGDDGDVEGVAPMQVDGGLESKDEVQLPGGVAGDNGESSVATSVNDSEYMYELVGVLAHNGAASRGHYYSFIKDRRTDADGQWYRFDDSRVTPFDVEELGSETFGGFDEALDLDASGQPTGVQTRSQTARAPAGSIQGLAGNLAGTSGNPPAGADNAFKVEKERNAYLLFYQRVENNATVPATPAAAAVINGNGNSDVAHLEQKFASLGLNTGRERAEGELERSFKTLLPPYLQQQQQQIWSSNLQLLRDRHSFDQKFFTFLWDVVNKQLDTFPMTEAYPNRGNANSDLTLLTAQACTLFVLDTYARARNNKKLRDWIALLQVLYERSLPACHWLIQRLAGDQAWLRSLLLDCQVADTRELVVSLLDWVVSRLIEHEVDVTYENKLKPIIVPGLGPKVDVKKIMAASAALSYGVTISSKDSASASSAAMAATPKPKPKPEDAVDEAASLTSGKTEALFSAKALADGQLSLNSPPSVLVGMGAKSINKLNAVGIKSISDLSKMTSDQRDDLMGFHSLPETQLDKWIVKASQAVDVLSAVMPIASTETPVESKGDEKGPAGVPSTSPTASSVTAAVADGKTPTKAAEVKKVKVLQPAGEWLVVPRFAATLARMIDDMNTYGDGVRHSISECCELMTRFARKSPQCMDYLARAGVTSACLRLYARDVAQPGSDAKESKLPPGKTVLTAASSSNGSGSSSSSSSSGLPSWAWFEPTSLLTLLSVFLPNLALAPPSGQPTGRQPAMRPSGLITELPAMELATIRSLIAHRPLLSKLAVQKVTKGEPVHAIATALCWDNMALSEAIVGVCMAAINEYDYFDFYICIQLLQELLAIRDALAPKRNTMIMKELFSTMKKNCQFWKATDHCIAMVLYWTRDKRTSDLVGHWLAEQVASKHELLSWIKPWLIKHKKAPKASVFNGECQLLKIPMDREDRNAPAVPGRGDNEGQWNKLFK